MFTFGILVSIALVGAATAATGRMLGDLGPGATYAVACVFFVFGLHLLGVLPLPEMWRPQPTHARRSALGALLFGLISGFALGPSTFGFMAPVLGITFGTAHSAPLFAAAVLILFAIGHCTVIALAGASSTWVGTGSRGRASISARSGVRRACGVLVLLAGGWLVYAGH